MFLDRQELLRRRSRAAVENSKGRMLTRVPHSNPLMAAGVSPRLLEYVADAFGLDTGFRANL